MPIPDQNGPSDELKLQALREAEERAKAAKGVQPGRKRPTKYTAHGISKAEVQALTPYYVDLGPKPKIFRPSRYKWYWRKHVERKKLRKQLKYEHGVTKRTEFEQIAREVGLGIDNPLLAFLSWLLSWLTGAGGIASLVGAAALVLGTMYAYSYVSEQVGSFTIQLNPETMQNGFVLSDTADFASVTGRLRSEEIFKVNAISLADLEKNLDDVDGCHNSKHAICYTFYIKNQSEETRSYEYVLRMTDSVYGVDKAVWAMVYEDGKQILYTAPNENDEPELIWGYSTPPFFEDAYNCETQYYFYLIDYSLNGSDVEEETDMILRDSDGNRVKFNMSADGTIHVIEGNLTDEEKETAIVKANGRNSRKLWGVVPHKTYDENVVMCGIVEDIKPDEYHKYTVVLWLEGNDNECTDELFGGYAKYMMEFNPITEESRGLFKNIYRTEYDFDLE